MLNNKISRVCVVETIYTLFLYLIISTEREIEETFFFWSSGIPSNIRDYFKDQSYYFEPDKLNQISYRNLCLKLRITRLFKWPFLLKRNITFWGHSHLKFSCGIIGNNKLNIIEDGIGNYFPLNIKENHKRELLKKILFGSFYILENEIGTNPSCSNIYLTGLLEINPKIKNKTIIINTKKEWDNTTNNKKNLIFNVFNIKNEDLNIFSNRPNVLLTQCFSEDGSCSEESKIRMYRDIVKNYDTEQLIIKPHPRETTDYSLFFPEIIIYTKKIPLEILMLLGAKIRKVITIHSTAAYNLPPNIESEILGIDFFNKYK